MSSEIDYEEQHHLDAEMEIVQIKTLTSRLAKKTGAQSGETGGSDGEGHPNPKKTLLKKLNRPKQKRLPPFEPVHIPLEERKFCTFHEVVKIPPAIACLPKIHRLTAEELQAFKIC